MDNHNCAVSKFVQKRLTLTDKSGSQLVLVPTVIAHRGELIERPGEYALPGGDRASQHEILRWAAEHGIRVSGHSVMVQRR